MGQTQTNKLKKGKASFTLAADPKFIQKI